jgi:hypothetical protein
MDGSTEGRKDRLRVPCHNFDRPFPQAILAFTTESRTAREKLWHGLLRKWKTRLFFRVALIVALVGFCAKRYKPSFPSSRSEKNRLKEERKEKSRETKKKVPSICIAFIIDHSTFLPLSTTHIFFIIGQPSSFDD